MSDQSKGLDSEKVRLHYSCSSSSSPTLPLSGTKPLLNAHPFSQSPPSHPPSIMSFWMTLFSYQIWKLMRKVKSTLQQNEGRDKKGKKSIILVFYHHPQNEKKNENQPMADEEIPEGFSNSSPDDSPSTLLCPPGARDLEQSAVTPRKPWKNSHLCRDQTTAMVPSVEAKTLRCWWLKYQQVVKRCVCVYLFLMMARNGRDGSGVWEGREAASFQFRAQTRQSLATQTLGMRTGWRLKISDHWRFLPEHFIPLVRRKRSWYFWVFPRSHLGRGVSYGWFPCGNGTSDCWFLLNTVVILVGSHYIVN